MLLSSELFYIVVPEASALRSFDTASSQSNSKIARYFEGLEKSSKLASLKNTDLDSSRFNAKEALAQVAEESGFSVVFVEIGDHAVTGKYVALAQVEQNADRIFIARGAAPDKGDEAFYISLYSLCWLCKFLLAYP